MTLLLDTHVLLWIVLESPRLAQLRGLDSHRPWGLSPVTLLEVQFLAEVGRLTVTNPEFTNRILADARFLLDDVPLLRLVRHALDLGWTRDPFDRLLAAHSLARRVPLLTVDRHLLAHHPLAVAQA